MLLGVQSPRVSLVPPAVKSEGDDAAWFSSQYGLTPDDWQSAVLRSWLGVDESGRWAAPRCGLAVPRQNGKNVILEIRELYGMVALGERFLHTAHQVKTARKAFKRLLYFFDNEREFPELARLVAEVRHTNGQEAIVLKNGGSVEFVARSKGSARGYTVDVLACDEAQEFSEEALAALQPTISAAPQGNPQMILTGTPPWPNMDGGIFTRFREGGHAGVPRSSWHEWSCELGADPDDPGNWAIPNPSLGRGRPGALTRDAIADERATMSAETFSFERLGIWPDTDSAGLIPYRQWRALSDPVSEPSEVVSYGIDVTPDRVWASMAVSGWRADHGVHVDVDDELRERGTDWVVPRCVELSAKHPGAQFAIDATGPGASLIPALEAAGLPLTLMTLTDIRKACGLFVDAVVEGTVRHRGQRVLDDAVAGAKPRPLGDGGFAFGRVKSDIDISPLNAACFAHWVSVLFGPGDVAAEFG